MEKIRHLLYVRTDSIGDNVLAAGMLPLLYEHFGRPRVTVVCQEHIAELYEHCPYVAGAITFNKRHFIDIESYRTEICRVVALAKADVTLNTIYSRDAISDLLSLATGAPLRVAYIGDRSNLTPQAHEAQSKYYSHLIQGNAGNSLELVRHQVFLHALGIKSGSPLVPTLWTTAREVAQAERVFSEYGLDPAKTVALFAGAQFAIRLYGGYGAALGPVCQDLGLRIVALGTQGEASINQQQLDAAGTDGVNLSGKLSIRESAEVLRRCIIAVGAETGLAHVACAVGTRNVIVLGGGHFGRFMPYSPLTSVISLPLQCYGCNWLCRYTRPHCIVDIFPQTVEMTVRAALKYTAPRPRLVIQDSTLFNATFAGPQWGLPQNLIDSARIELITVGATNRK